MRNVETAASASTAEGDGLTEAVVHTERRLVTNEAICHFIEATGDDNEIHMSDTVARAEGFVRHCAHAGLINHIGVDLIRRKERETGSLPKQVEATWRNVAPVYPGDEVFVQYSKFVSHGLAKIKATIYCSRESQDIIVATGKITAVLGALKLSGN